MKWEPKGKRPRGRPRKRLVDLIEEDLKKIRRCMIMRLDCSASGELKGCM